MLVAFIVLLFAAQQFAGASSLLLALVAATLAASRVIYWSEGAVRNPLERWPWPFTKGRLRPAMWTMLAFVVLFLAGGLFVDAVTVFLPFAALTLVCSNTVYWNEVAIEAARDYDEDGVPLPRPITRKMDRWRRRHPDEQPPWEQPRRSGDV